ncbi:TPA: membrane-targeted effector domain-containing toxin, partial [Legionella anisa]
MKLLYLFLGVLLLGGGVAQTEEALDTEKFSGVLKSYFSSVSPVLSKKPIERTRDLFEEPFIVGECHSHISPKKFLIENMKKMKQNGYEVLFMEHLFYDTNQKDLDEFFKTGKMSTELINQLREMNQHGLGYSFGPSSKITSSLWKNNDYVAVLHAAREAGIRVVGIDISTVYRSQKIGIDNQQLDNTRIRYMNYTAAQIMKREIGFLSKGKKWCGFMGNTHVSTFENTPGVAELLDARSVYVFDQPQWTNSTQPFKGCVDCNGEYIYSSG